MVRLMLAALLASIPSMDGFQFLPSSRGLSVVPRPFRTPSTALHALSATQVALVVAGGVPLAALYTFFRADRLLTEKERQQEVWRLMEEKTRQQEEEKLKAAADKSSGLPSLVYYGDAALMTPIVEQVAEEEILTPAFQEKLSMLKECQRHYRGLGIAAPQVGWRARVFCMGSLEGQESAVPAKDKDAFSFGFWINPQLSWEEDELPSQEKEGDCFFWEGCLSVPGQRGWVKRPRAVRLSGFNEKGERVSVALDGLLARVAQHEADHLDGVLFPQRTIQGTLLPLASFQGEGQDKWPPGWPTKGARSTPPGTLAYEL